MAFEFVKKTQRGPSVLTGARLSPNGYLTISQPVMESMGFPTHIAFKTDKKVHKVAFIPSDGVNDPYAYAVVDKNSQGHHSKTSFRMNIKGVASKLGLKFTANLKNFHWDDEMEMYIGEYE